MVDVGGGRTGKTKGAILNHLGHYSLVLQRFRYQFLTYADLPEACELVKAIPSLLAGTS